MWNSGRLDYTELPHIFHKDVKDEHFAKVTGKSEIPTSLKDKKMENPDGHGCTKVQDLVYEEMSVCWSYPVRHKTTLHCAERNVKLFDILLLHHLKL